MFDLMIEMLGYLVGAMLIGLILGFLIWGWGRRAAVDSARREGLTSARTSMDGDSALRSQLENSNRERALLEANVSRLNDRITELQAAVSQAGTRREPGYDVNTAGESGAGSNVTPLRLEPHMQMAGAAAAVTGVSQILSDDTEDKIETAGEAIKDFADETVERIGDESPGDEGVGDEVAQAVEAPAEALEEIVDATVESSDAVEAMVGAAREEISAAADAAEETMPPIGSDELTDATRDPVDDLRASLNELSASRLGRDAESDVTDMQGPETSETDPWSTEGPAEAESSDRSEDRDDLTMIDGIGEMTQHILNENGVYRFDQLAEFSDRDFAWLETVAGMSQGQIDQQFWIDQAKELIARKSESSDV